jgi:hypothetical protein
MLAMVGEKNGGSDRDLPVAAFFAISFTEIG